MGLLVGVRVADGLAALVGEGVGVPDAPTSTSIFLAY